MSNPYLIAFFNSGLMNNIEPWLLPEDAFQFLENAYVWRGRVKKRWGYSYLGSTDLKSRLRIDLGDTDGSGDISVSPVPGTVFAIGQMFSIGDEIFTVYQTGTPGDMLTTGSSTTATYDTTTGDLVINGAAATTACYFYPATPVMGLLQRESINVNFENVIGFDTQFSYIRSGGAWERLDTATSWTGSDSDFFWGTNYRAANIYETNFYVVNGIVADQIKYILEGDTTWASLRPQLDSGATRFLDTAKIIIGFKDRLLVFNTTETTGGNQFSYKNRVRWSQNGNPTVAAKSWLDDTTGVGGYLDCSTQESITTVQLLKDRLIVYFERSTWELVYNGDSVLPFIWQKINSELGAESEFSIIGFDKEAVGVGNVGIHKCNGVNVERIDVPIPDLVFNINNGNNGVKRVYGIRDYYRELVYWTYPNDTGSPTYPTNVLIWNYQNNTWAIFYDSLTCFGYLQQDSNLTWADLGSVYGTWAGWNDPWSGARSQAQFSNIIAGNQEGFTHLINTEKSSNAPSLYITNMDSATYYLTVINHNLLSGDYIKVTECQGITSLNDNIYKVSVINSNTILLDTTFSGTYTGGGKLTRISNLNITSKQWNPGTPIGEQFRMPYMDFLLASTSDGEVAIDYFINSTSGDSIEDQSSSDVLLGSNILYTKPEDNQTYQPNQIRIWHRYYLEAQGEFIQIKIFMNDDQIRDSVIAESEFILDGIILYPQPQGRIIG